MPFGKREFEKNYGRLQEPEKGSTTLKLKLRVWFDAVITYVGSILVQYNKFWSQGQCRRVNPKKKIVNK